MPGILDSIPRDAYAANARLGTRAECTLPGQMRLVRGSRGRPSIVLMYRAHPIATFESDGTLMLHRPRLTDERTGDYLPTRGLFDRYANLVPDLWTVEGRPATRRWPARYPYLVYRDTYRYPFESNVSFFPNGDVSYGYGQMSRIELDHAVEQQRNGDRHLARHGRTTPAPRETRVDNAPLPSWVGRTTEQVPARRRGGMVFEDVILDEPQPGELQLAAYDLAAEPTPQPMNLRAAELLRALEGTFLSQAEAEAPTRERQPWELYAWADRPEPCFLPSGQPLSRWVDVRPNDGPYEQAVLGLHEYVERPNPSANGSFYCYCGNNWELPVHNLHVREGERHRYSLGRCTLCGHAARVTPEDQSQRRYPAFDTLARQTRARQRAAYDINGYQVPSFSSLVSFTPLDEEA